MSGALSLRDRVLQYLRDDEDTHTSDLDNPIWCLGQQYNNPSTDTDGDARPEKVPYPPDFLKDVSSRLWFTYRTGFSLIPSSPGGPSPLSFRNIIRGQFNNPNGFTTDCGWGCMIRTGQCLLGNALLSLIPRDCDSYREQEEKVISWFADSPDAPFSIHNFVSQGQQSGKYPGEWFGPSTTAYAIRELCKLFSPVDIKVYVSSDGSGVYEDEFMRAAMQEGEFKPTLILVGLRLGIEGISQIYWDAMKACLEVEQAVGIAGGRPASSHYFLGHQGDYLFYLDPHHPRPFLPYHEDLTEYTQGEISSTHCHTLRKLHCREMDPSMLVGFLIRDMADWERWKQHMQNQDCKSIMYIADVAPTFSGSGTTKEGFIDLGDNDEDDSGGSFGGEGSHHSDDDDDDDGNKTADIICLEYDDDSQDLSRRHSYVMTYEEEMVECEKLDYEESDSGLQDNMYVEIEPPFSPFFEPGDECALSTTLDDSEWNEAAAPDMLDRDGISFARAVQIENVPQTYLPEITNSFDSAQIVSV